MLTIFKKKVEDTKDDNIIEVESRDVPSKSKSKTYDDSYIPFIVMIIGTMGVVGALAGVRIANIKANNLPMTAYNLLKTYKCLPGHFKENYLNEVGDQACIKHSTIVNLDTARRYGLAEAQAYKKMEAEQKRVYMADIEVSKAQATFDLNNGAALRQGVDVTFNANLGNITNGVVGTAQASTNQPNNQMSDHEVKNKFDSIQKIQKPPKRLNYPFLY